MKTKVTRWCCANDSKVICPLVTGSVQSLGAVVPLHEHGPRRACWLPRVCLTYHRTHVTLAAILVIVGPVGPPYHTDTGFWLHFMNRLKLFYISRE